MNKQELLKKILISLNALQGQVFNRFLPSDEIKKYILSAERSKETIKNYYFSDEYVYLLDELNFTLKAINHYFDVRKSIDPAIKNDVKLHITLKNKIDDIIKTINNLTDGNI